MAAVTAVGLLHRSLLAFGIVSHEGRKRGKDDSHSCESQEEEACVMEEAGKVDGDPMASDVQGDNAETAADTNSAPPSTPLSPTARE